MSSSEAGPLANYNSLTDKHLCGFFRNARTQRHLRRMGLITKRGEVVSEEMFRISHARREHKKHVRELLAQAIVHKTLDLERTRQIQIRNRLEEMAKRELVERVKSERSMKGDEDVLSLMSPRSKPRKKASSAKSGSRKSKGDDNTYMSDDSAAQDPSERPKSSKSAKSIRSNFEIDANGLPVFKRNDEVVDSQYLSRLTPRALRQFTMSLTNIDYMSGISPYVLPQVEPVPPQTPRQQGTRSSTAGSPRNTRSRGQRRSLQVASLHPPHEEVQHPRRLETQVKVTMKYLGIHKEKWGAANQSGGSQTHLEEEPDEILLMQQHCGGNTYPIFRGFLYRNTEFAFYSKRHRGYPFSITLYINGKADSRISTCCEFKHSPKGEKPFVKLGGKLGRFSFGKSESEKNEGMCYRCRAEAKLALDDNKNKTDDDYDEDFQESSAEEEELDYKVTVYTGDEAGAGTNANVKITLFGDLGDSGEVELDRKLEDNFERGKKDVFDLKFKDLGKLEKVKISQDGSGFKSAWFLDKIVVEQNGEKTVFYCNQWLTDEVDEDDSDAEPTNEVTLTAGGDRPPTPIEYSLDVYTGSVDNAGTDADVFITIYGKRGNSGTKLLDKAGKNDFETKSVGKYKIKCGNLGVLEKLKVWHDGSGLGSSWFLEKIVVTGGAPKVTKSVFYCNDWLSDDMDDKTLSCTLVAKPPEVTYTVTVYTGSESGAGTDADVFVQVYGSEGDSGVKQLDKSGQDDFEAESVGKYQIECQKLGKLEKMRVWHDGSGFGADWFLNKIVVSRSIDSVEFVCNKWFSDSKDDEQTERILVPLKAEGSVQDAEGETAEEKAPDDEGETDVDYDLVIFTGMEAGSGTDAKEFKVNLLGELGESGDVTFEREGDSLSRGCEDTYPITCKELGDLKKLKISHDGTGFKSAWFLEKVEVTDSGSGEKTVFHCGQWIGKPQGGMEDCVNERILMADDEAPSSTKDYAVTVYTGSDEKAGTDADVFIKLMGGKGESPTKLMDKKAKNDFERNSKETFTVKSADLGTINKLKIWHDGSGFGSAWFLDKVVVKDADDVYVFYCRDWLSDDMEGKTLSKILPASQPEVKYSLAVYTSEVTGGGTDANVYVQLYGSEGDSSKQVLVKSGENDFEAGTIGKYDIECQPLGELQKLKVGHDGSGFGSDWYLEKIVVTNEGQETVFACNEWLSDSNEDHGIERTLYPSEETPSEPEETAQEEPPPEPEQTIQDESPFEAEKTIQEVEYLFVVYTGDVSGAGTDADVSIQLFGSSGDSGTQQLDKEGDDDFEQGTQGEYTITCLPLGRLEKLRIWHDGSGFGSDWYLEKVEVKHEGETTVFECNQWLSDSNEGSTTEQILYPKGPEVMPDLDYEFSVFTGDVSGAGTDSKVSMTLYGHKGDSGVLSFDKQGQDDFERNSKGVYAKKFKDIGDVQKLKVWHNGEGFGAGWFLDKVEVVKTRADGSDKETTVFQCNKWLDENEDDGQTERELYPFVPEFKPKQTKSYFNEGFSDSEELSDFGPRSQQSHTTSALNTSEERLT